MLLIWSAEERRLTRHTRPPRGFPGFRAVPPRKCRNAATAMAGMGFGVAAAWRVRLGGATAPARPVAGTLRGCGVLSATPSAMPGVAFGETLRRGGKFRGVHAPHALLWLPIPPDSAPSLRYMDDLRHFFRCANAYPTNDEARVIAGAGNWHYTDPQDLGSAHPCIALISFCQSQGILNFLAVTMTSAPLTLLKKE
ncbi:hypothetical protein [Nitrosomonas communis]|uniref:Uncharacterized protein n=1 Tax=Nitrosomonas communis TaxID=44574 RepID=A0A1I4RJ49_9PROT|nr:hypothetical protein [Nitrosomonas communis]SFM51973.1 hypothetical protein SAMN05421863_103315 [Nitrosomonas communis]